MLTYYTVREGPSTRQRPAMHRGRKAGPRKEGLVDLEQALCTLSKLFDKKTTTTSIKGAGEGRELSVLDLKCQTIVNAPTRGGCGPAPSSSQS